MTSRLETGNSWTFFYGAVSNALYLFKFYRFLSVSCLRVKYTDFYHVRVQYENVLSERHVSIPVWFFIFLMVFSMYCMHVQTLLGLLQKNLLKVVKKSFVFFISVKRDWLRASDKKTIFFTFLHILAVDELVWVPRTANPWPYTIIHQSGSLHCIGRNVNPRRYQINCNKSASVEQCAFTNFEVKCRQNRKKTNTIFYKCVIDFNFSSIFGFGFYIFNEKV